MPDAVARVAIVVPSYNHEATIERCLQSVSAQTSGDWTCLVVDDCSSDRTVELARSFADRDERFTVVVNDRNLGLVGNHNECLRLADGELVKFVHADDWLLPNCLDVLSAPFDDPAVTFAFAARRVDGDEAWASTFGVIRDPLDWSRGAIAGGELLQSYVEHGGFANWFGEPSAVMFRTATMRSVGGFSALLAQALDTELWLRLIAAGSAVRIPDELSVRFHSDTTATERNRTTGEFWLDGAWVLLSLAWMSSTPRSARMRARLYAVRALRRTVIDNWGALRDQRRRQQLLQLLGPRRRRRFAESVRIERDGR